MGLNYKFVAVKYINDVCFPGIDKEPLIEKGPMFKKLNRLITVTNLFCKLGLIKPRIIGITIFKEAPTDVLKNKLQARGFKLINLPANPHI